MRTIGDKSKIVSVDIRNLEKDKLEFGSFEDADLMHITCYATHEGVNLNGTEFSRGLLMRTYKSFVDKPVVMVPNYLGEPTGHGFDFINKKFDDDKRKVVGHIASAIPVFVSKDGEPHVIPDDESQTMIENLDSDGQVRILCQLVIYKHYMQEVAETLERLHKENKLRFSMEGVMDADVDDNNIAHATDINFTGLAIVENPAFVNSYSINVAEQLEGGENSMANTNNGNGNGGGTNAPKNDLQAKYDELLKKYNDLKAKYDALVKQKGGNNQNQSQNNTASVNEEKYQELLETIVDLKSEVAELKPYKEQVETAEKLKVGKERHERLASLGNEDKTVEELAELTVAEYVELLDKAIDDKQKKTVDEGSQVVGQNFHTTTKKSDKETLMDALNALFEEE